MSNEQTPLEWLRDRAEFPAALHPTGYPEKFRLAADEIERLQAERDKLRKALERIIQAWDSDSESMHDDPADIAREALK